MTSYTENSFSKADALTMHKYLCVVNEGAIESGALTLMGASTKRGDATKIGMFGSGNKYALAYFIRNGYKIRIFSDGKEIEVGTKEVVFKDRSFNMITVDGKETSLTTDMGPNWQLWEAVRELYSNAIDEGGALIQMTNEIKPYVGKTYVYIELKENDPLYTMFEKFDLYFNERRKPLFEGIHGKIYPKITDTVNLYRKGIRCFDGHIKSMFDYDIPDATLDENRRVMYSWKIGQHIWELLVSCTSKEVLQKLFLDHSYQMWGRTVETDVPTITSYSNLTLYASKEFRELLSTYKLAPRSMLSQMDEDEVKMYCFLDTSIFDEFYNAKWIPEENTPFRTIKRKGEFAYKVVEGTPLMKAMLKNAMHFLQECKFPHISYPIKFFNSPKSDLYGFANEDDMSIYLSEILENKGVNEMVATIIEEYIHLKYSTTDKTREMQTAIIEEFVGYMKTINAYPL